MRRAPGAMPVSIAAWANFASSPTETTRQLWSLARVRAMTLFGEQQGGAGADDNRGAREPRGGRTRRARINDADRLRDGRARRDLDHDAILHQGGVERDDRIRAAEILCGEQRDQVGPRLRQHGGERTHRDAGRRGIREFGDENPIDDDEATRGMRRRQS